MSPIVRRLAVVTFSAPALVLSVAMPAQSSTEGDDPLFGGGCRYVEVETPTPVDPSAELCRPW